MWGCGQTFTAKKKKDYQLAKNSTTAKVAGVSLRTESKLVTFKSMAKSRGSPFSPPMALRIDRDPKESAAADADIGDGNPELTKTRLKITIRIARDMDEKRNRIKIRSASPKSQSF